MKREASLREMGYLVKSVWGCHWSKTKKENPEIVDFITTLDIQPRLVMRNSFKGGRTNSTRLYYECREGEKIHYVDFTSLYPSVNKNER